jgi:hypothetical protein
MGSSARRRWGRADRVKWLVVTAVFILMLTGALTNATDRPFGVMMATFWTALIALVWELAARTLTRVRS